METAALNPTQMHLLKLFAFNNSEEYAREVQMVLTRHFQAQLDAEADRLWDEGILNQEKLDVIRQEDLHAKWSDYGQFPKVDIIKLDDIIQKL